MDVNDAGHRAGLSQRAVRRWGAVLVAVRRRTARVVCLAGHQRAAVRAASGTVPRPLVVRGEDAVDLRDQIRREEFLRSC